MSRTLTYEAERSAKVLLEKLSGVQAIPFRAEARQQRVLQWAPVITADPAIPP